MAKITGPLMSLDASGSVAGTIVFSKWKGRNYVRQLVTPANPQTPTQTWVRAMFKFLGSQWAAIGSTAQGTWQTPAAQMTVSPFNAFMSAGQKLWTLGNLPQQEWQQAQVTYTASLTTCTSTGGVRHATLAIEPTDVANTSWSTIIYRSTTTGFTPGPSNLVAVVATPAGTVTSYIDTPLPAGTYYYVCQVCSVDGQKGTIHAQTTATVTND